MRPVLLTIGQIPISSFGFFTLVAILAGVYFIWRVIKAYDLDEEKIFDLILLTLLGSLIGGRIFYVFFNLGQFDQFFKVILINKYPGLLFWGAFLVGFITLKLSCNYFKLIFWQVLDFILIGFLLTLAISSLGCLLASCQYGLPSNLPIAVEQVGLVGKRFPLQIIESLLFLLSFVFVYKSSLKFHFTGQIAIWALFLFGLIKFCLEFFRGEEHRLGFILSVGTIIFALVNFYLLSKRSFFSDLKFLVGLTHQGNNRRIVIQKLSKSWYNSRIDWKVSLLKFKKRIFKNLNVKSNPSRF